ncbi:MAG: hypothetical protein IPL61_37590 [Myxococcales bacterium]|nr:hypothetical protein [Myxococcales bacterium]
MTVRTIAPVVQRKRLDDDDDSDSLAYWLAQPLEARILEVEALRRMWIERLGDPDRPMERVVVRRRLGDEG